MTKVQSFFFVTILFLCSAFTINLSQSWRISSGYNIKFSGTSASGVFKGLDGTIFFDENDLSTASMAVSVDVNTISTGNSTKDKHAKGESWFYAEKYPTITFNSSSFSKTGDDYEVLGNLTLRGVQKEITIPFKFNSQGDQGIFEGQFKVSRDAYGMKGPFFGFTVGDEFLIELKVPVE